MQAGGPEERRTTEYGDGIILVRRDGVVASLTLNRPIQRNALNREMLVALDEALGGLRRNTEVSVVVLEGAGTSFCAGVDISAEQRRTFYRPPQQIERLYQENGQALVRALQSLPQVTIAAVNGPAVGWGVGLATCCDFRVVADSAFFRIPEIGFGMYFDVGCLYGLLALVGPAHARRMTMLGDDIDAGEAVRIGLADRMTSASKLRDAAEDLARSLLRQNVAMLRSAKTCINAATVSRTRHLALVEVELAASYYGSNVDRFEGLAAYAERRAPQFSREQEAGTLTRPPQCGEGGLRYGFPSN